MKLRTWLWGITACGWVALGLLAACGGDADSSATVAYADEHEGVCNEGDLVLVVEQMGCPVGTRPAIIGPEVLPAPPETEPVPTLPVSPTPQPVAPEDDDNDDSDGRGETQGVEFLCLPVA